MVSSSPGLETSVTRKPASRRARKRPPRTRQVCADVTPTTMWGRCAEGDGGAGSTAAVERRLPTSDNVGKKQLSAQFLLRLSTSFSQKGTAHPDMKPESVMREETCSTISGVHAFKTLDRAILCLSGLLPLFASAASLVTTQKAPYTRFLAGEKGFSSSRKHWSALICQEENRFRKMRL